MSKTQSIGAIEARHIPVALIDRDPAQPRTHFDEAALHDLAESIREHGVIQPIEVEATADGRYVIHHGERRWRAAKLAGRETIPAIVAPARAADETLLRQLLENIHRADLNPIDEALIFQRLINMGWSRVRISKQTGRATQTINDRLTWLRLGPEIQHLVALGHLSPSRELANALLVLPERVRVPLAQRMVTQHLSPTAAVKAAQRAAEKLAQREEAEAAGKARRPTLATARPAHPVPMIRAAGIPAPNGNGAPPRPSATLAQAAEAMCRTCVFWPGGTTIPSWELLEQAAAATCEACERKNGPAIPGVCQLCQGVALLRQLVDGANNRKSDDPS